jgi:hypothetical protein
MAIDTTTLEGRAREYRNAALLQAKRHLQKAKEEIEYLIAATPTGERRNALTGANIHTMAAQEIAAKLSSEES